MGRLVMSFVQSDWLRLLEQITRFRKLRESTELRLKEIESEQELTPEVSDIASVFVEVHG